ncbi:MAG: dihydroorotate dehydrogenase electron transfer subunit [Planctomycetes bacterium]|nr:dihydroorotate dehydrogenase electron transfer subunit [Planctomycetota bacterium]
MPADIHQTCETRSARGVFETRVVANESICREHYRLTLAVDEFPLAHPGQFVQIMCTDFSDAGWTGGAFIRRPFSIGGLRRRAGNGISPPTRRGRPASSTVELDILHRAIGIGTCWLASLRPGDAVNILGPLGQAFPMPAAGGPPALLVGGGIGLPPLIWLAETLREAGVPAIAFCGARSADLLPLTRDPAVACRPDEPTLSCREFAGSGVPVLVATDDGSLGAHGLVPDVFADYVDRRRERFAGATVYTCGPERMMRAVAEVCRRRNLSCQVCLERMMACGMGTCQSCVVRIRDGSAPDGWRYRLCCTDGPVFDARDVIWE